ncbi:MAG: AsmA family protein [Candidatus Margulisiibacteriota bacterium]
MKKAIKWIAIVAGILVILLIVGVVALPFIIPVEKIKEFAVARISETINREVKIEKVSFNIFEGIKLEKLSISNREGFAKKPFITADAIALRYAFWPIFRREIIIKELRLVKPEILIEKNAAGVFNFSDLTKKKAEKAEKAGEAEKAGKGFSMIIDTFSIRGGRVTYVDYGTKTSSEIKNTDLTISGITLAMLKPIDFKFSSTAVYKGKNIPLSLSGKVGLDLVNDQIKIPSLSLGIAGEKANISANVSRLKTGPTINFSISSNKLSIDPLLAVFTAGATAPKKKEPGATTKTVNKFTASIPAKLRLKGDFDIGNLSLLNFKVDKAKLGVVLDNKIVSADVREIRIYDGTLSGKTKIYLSTPGVGYSANLKLAGLDAAPFANAIVETFLTKLTDYKDLVNKVYGKLDVSFGIKGQGVEVSDILANADASGSLSLKNGELKRLKTVDAIADKIKAPALKQDLKISELSASFTMKNQVVNIKDLDLKDHDINVAFKGGIDLAKLIYVSGNRLTLKGSPSLTKGLSKEYDLFRDDKGWLEITFELTGDLKKPIPAPVLEKPVEKAIGKIKLKIEAKKVEIEEAAQKKVEEEKARLKKEAEKKVEEEKKRLEEEAKKQLKDLIKF